MYSSGWGKVSEFHASMSPELWKFPYTFSAFGGSLHIKQYSCSLSPKLREFLYPFELFVSFHITCSCSPSRELNTSRAMEISISFSAFGGLLHIKFLSIATYPSTSNLLCPGFRESHVFSK
jgi:hypothetical protein